MTSVSDKTAQIELVLSGFFARRERAHLFNTYSEITGDIFYKLPSPCSALATSKLKGHRGQYFVTVTFYAAEDTAEVIRFLF